jgi:hypothetical protein
MNLEGQNLSGQLSDWSINDLLQIMQVTKKTGSLDIEAERRGRIHFIDGAVTGAELLGDKGSYKGSDVGAIADILYVLSAVETGAFAVGPSDGPDADGFAVEDVLEEVSALRSLEGEVVDAGLFEAQGVRLVRDLEEPISVEPADWSVLVSLVPPFTFDTLEARVGRGGAVRIFHTLHRLGVAEPTESDDESQWLDRLAVGLASESPQPIWLEQGTPAPAAREEPEGPSQPEPSSEPVPERSPEPAQLRGVAADASTTLTDGVYDEIRRLRSKVADK